jgi:hypothetical protein
MARINNLENFLTDVATSIKNKKGTTDKIPAEKFDTEIAGIDTLNGEDIIVTPTTKSQEITPSEGKNAITKVNVEAVTSDIDSNIVSNNIKKGVTVLGVEGTLEENIVKPTQDKTVAPAINEQTVTPDAGYELTSVTVEAVTSDIDSNIQPENIKKDTTILGITGTLEGTENLDTELAEQDTAVENLNDNIQDTILATYNFKPEYVNFGRYRW